MNNKVIYDFNDINNKGKCCGCENCKNKCPQNAIYMQYDVEGLIYPVVDKAKCVNCGICKNKLLVDNAINTCYIL